MNALETSQHAFRNQEKTKQRSTIVYFETDKNFYLKLLLHVRVSKLQNLYAVKVIYFRPCMSSRDFLKEAII